MTDKRNTPELDLIGYADGRFDGDPAHLSEIGEALRAMPEELRRAEDYQAQTQALRRRFGPRVAEPVPDRLYAALDRPGPRHRPRMAAAAVAALMFVAAAAGWSLGRDAEVPGFQTALETDPAYRIFAAAAAGPGEVLHLAALDTGKARPQLPRRLTLSIEAPDLTDLSYSLNHQGTVRVGDEEIVRLVYADADDRTFSVFLRPRADLRDSLPKLATEAGVSIVYWLDGPLSVAVSSRQPAEETTRIAAAVRTAMRGAGIAVRSDGTTASGVDGGLAAAPDGRVPADLSPDAAPQAAPRGSVLPVRN